MHIRYFDDEHNRDLVSEVLITFDCTRVNSMIMTLPGAMFALMELMPRMPESEHTDFAADEEHRKALNRVIQLAGLLEEFMRLTMDQKLVTAGFDIMEPYYWGAVGAFVELQRIKDARISITHRDLGEHFGRKTGFQEFSYQKVAQEITDWIRRRRDELEKEATERSAEWERERAAGQG